MSRQDDAPAVPSVVLHVRRLVLDAGLDGAASAHALRGPAFQAALQCAVSEALGQHLRATGSSPEPASPAGSFASSLAGSIVQAVVPHVAAATPGAVP
jgi:hypothetical protein